jgi:hypothetical protein
MGATPMSTAEKTTAAPTQHHWLRIALAVVALVELADALSSIHNIFYRLSPPHRALALRAGAH